MSVQFPPISPRVPVTEEPDAELDVLDQPNPFVLPSDDVFMMREMERQKRLAAKSKQRQLKIWEKGGHRGKPTIRYKDRQAMKKNYHSAKQDRIFHGHHREKENMADFIAKKRAMFLIQMSLDTKRAEIQKLEEKTQMKEDALKKSEMMLEDDALRFDQFLKDNDRKAHDALKWADQESKEKAEKKAELKKLNQEISRITSEMAKCEETKKSIELHKTFLDSVTPQEFKDAQAERRAEKLRELKGIEPHEATEEDWDDISDDEMFFKDPEQLQNIFAHLEERNLFLIQNVQETEEALEELKQKFEEGKNEMDEKNDALEKNIQDLAFKMQHEEQQKSSLLKRAKVSGTSEDQRMLLEGLSNKIAAIYEDCGFEEGGNDPLDMLRDLERWLEYLLHEIKKYNEEDSNKVLEEEKAIKDFRRREWREAVKEEVQKQAEERQAKSTARAKAQIVRHTGKQVMFRSPPAVKKVKKEKKKEINPDAEELLRYLT